MNACSLVTFCRVGPPGRFGDVVQRALGLFGGLVCAGAASLAAFYRCAVVAYPFAYWLVACVAFVVLFGMLGLRWPRYFRHFFMPIVMFLAHADGVLHADEGRPWSIALASLALLVALAALLVGALFQVQVAAIAGMCLFVGYAIAALGFTRASRRPA